MRNLIATSHMQLHLC